MQETDSGTGSNRTQSTASQPVRAIQDIKNISDIQKEYVAIQAKLAAGSMDSTSFNYNCHNETSGRVTYFFEGRNLRVVKQVYNEYDHFSAKDYYYLKDDSLIFVLYDRLTWSFDSDAGGQDATKDEITESRYYIINNKFANCLQKKFTVRSSSPNNPNTETVPNKKVNCSSFQPVYNKLKLLVRFKTNIRDTTCLE